MSLILFRTLLSVFKKPSISKVCGCHVRHCNTRKHEKILGIETSCDDTGCAIIDTKGHLLGECLMSQQRIHTQLGGIIPPLACNMHRANIEKVVNNALTSAKLSVADIDAVAVTVRPGLPLSLAVGVNHAKFLCTLGYKPLIPIHHMEAHALTIRLIEKVDFPFLVLLISGGNCLIAIAQSVNKFQLLGKTLDDAPGEAFDKIFHNKAQFVLHLGIVNSFSFALSQPSQIIQDGVPLLRISSTSLLGRPVHHGTSAIPSMIARRLKIWNMEGFDGMSGGRAIEILSTNGDPTFFPISEPLVQSSDCNFSFSGIKNSARQYILEEEKKHSVEGGEILPNIADFCASVQLAVSKHFCRRIQRAMTYAEKYSLIPRNRQTLVVSGGVAANRFIGEMISRLCDEMEYKLFVPPPKLCTDNGVMIAWNGVEKWREGVDIVSPEQLHTVDLQGKAPFGVDMTQKVASVGIKCRWVKSIFSQKAYYLSP